MRNSAMSMKFDIIAAIVLTLSAVQASGAYTQDQLQWEDWETSELLYWGDNFSIGNYTITVDDFPRLEDSRMVGAPFVRLSLFENGSYAASLNLTLDDSYIYNDEIRITVTGLTTNASEWSNALYKPYARLKVERLGVPELSPGYSATFRDETWFRRVERVNCSNVSSVSRETVTEWIYDEALGRYRRLTHLKLNVTEPDCRDNFTFVSSTNEVLSVPPESRIHLKIQVTNTGTADAYDIFVKIIPDVPVQEGLMEYGIGDLKKGDNSPEAKLVLIAPGNLIDTKELSELVKVTGKDIKGNRLSSQTYFNFSIGKQWNLILNKHGTPSIWKNNGTAFVTLSAYNDGWLDLKNIRLQDGVSEKFISQVPDLNWTIDLAAGTSWNFTYALTPNGTGTSISHPVLSAVVELGGTNYSIISGQSVTEVNGVDIRLDKSADTRFIERNATTNVTVTVTASNMGTVDALVNISDSGDAKKTVLKAGGSYSFSYILPVSAAITLPSATASYQTLYGDKGIVSSGTVRLELAAVETPISPSEMQMPPPAVKRPSGGTDYTIVFIIVIILLIAGGGMYLWKRRKG